MMLDTRIVVVSCPHRKPLQDIWLKRRETQWPDCPFPIDILSPENDVGWNANLIAHLDALIEPYVLLMLDDNFLGDAAPGEYTRNIDAVLRLMRNNPDFVLVKLQAGGAAAPELHFPDWERIREYDRAHHPFKRTNLIPTMYRRSWLRRLSAAVLAECGPERDIGRKGAIEFEMTGTLLTKDAALWPERMFGIHRPDPDGGGGHALLACIANDAVTGGKVRDMEPLRSLCVGVPGIEAFL